MSLASFYPVCIQAFGVLLERSSKRLEMDPRLLLYETRARLFVRYSRKMIFQITMEFNVLEKTCRTIPA